MSGGDPLFLDDSHLLFLFKSLYKIPHVQFVRIGTKVPIVLPQRITEEFTKLIRSHFPIYFSIHVTHPKELTSEVQLACEKLIKAGASLMGQTVLLKGVNNSLDCLKELFQKMLTFGIKPYALYQCDAILGSSHFRVPLEEGMQLVNNLRGEISGYAIPHFILDPTGGSGKIALLPQAIVKKEQNGYRLRDSKGKEVFYYEPSIQ